MREYWHNGFITSFEFILAKILRFGRLAKGFVFFLYKQNWKIYHILPQNIPDDIRYITIAFSDRTFPTIGHTGNFEIYGIKYTKKNRRIPVKQKYCAFKYALKYRMFDFGWLIQYVCFSDSIKNIDISKREVIVEECMCIEQQLLCALLRRNSVGFTITQRGVMDIPYCFQGAKILVNNCVTYDAMKLLNNDVKYEQFYPINLQKKKCGSQNKRKNREFKLGYLTDMGNFIINFIDKKKMDEIINDVCKDLRMPCSVSIHPQEKERGREYYENAFKSSYVNLRTELKLEEYFSNIDLLIGWNSTALFQAFLFEIPVIVLDFFADFQLKDFVAKSEGVVVCVHTKKELACRINEFREISLEDVHEKYIRARHNLGISLQ